MYFILWVLRDVSLAEISCTLQIQNANPQHCYYLVCLSCIYSCDDHAGAISARVSMLQNCPWSQSIFGKVKMSESASVVTGFQESAWKLMGVIGEVPTTHRGQVWNLSTQGLGHGVDLSHACENVLLSGRAIGATLCDHPRVSCYRTITTRDICAVVRMSLSP